MVLREGMVLGRRGIPPVDRQTPVKTLPCHNFVCRLLQSYLINKKKPQNKFAFCLVYSKLTANRLTFLKIPGFNGSHSSLGEEKIYAQGKSLNTHHPILAMATNTSAHHKHDIVICLILLPPSNEVVGR